MLLKSWNNHAIVQVSIVLVLIACTIACTCKLKHPQEHVCDADFVITVRVRRPITTADGLTAYKVRIKKFFKDSPKVKIALSKKFIYTIPGKCDVRLDRKTTYVLAGDVEGGKPWISACSFSEPWRSLAPKMKKGFKLLYRTGCDCNILSCHWWGKCPQGHFFCPWETSTEEKDCQGRHGVCLRRPNGTCDWFGGRLYRSCMKNRTITRNESVTYDITRTNQIYGKRRRKMHHHRKQSRKGFTIDKSLYAINNI